LLRWSPCGSYLFLALTCNAIIMFETTAWTHQRWETDGGPVQDACWGIASSKSPVLIFVTKGSTQVVGVQFTSKPPSLEAHLLPLQMQGTLSLNAPTGSTPAEITALAWDATSSHLALILGGGHPQAGQVALYSTRCAPMLSAQFVQCVAGRDPPPGPGQNPDADTTASCSTSEVGGKMDAESAGSQATAIAFSGDGKSTTVLLAIRSCNDTVSLCSLSKIDC